jgi:flagellar hook-associated protein 3 FlgL
MSVSASFRVTQRSSSLGVQNNLQRGISSLQALQDKLSSGREISRPSDSPGGTSSALALRADIARLEQFDRNANDGAGWLAESDNALQGSTKVLQRGRDLAISAVNSALNSTDREALAVEVDGLREQLLALSNSSRLGRPLFSGNALPGAGQPNVAYDNTGTYVGDAGKVVRPVADGAAVQVNLTGPDVYGPAASNAFKVLTDLAANIRANNTTAITAASINDIDTALTRLQTGLATIGARTNQLETLQSRNVVSRDNRTNSLNEIESIDLPKTLTDLKLQELAYQASLSAASRVIQPSLMDFLR